MGPAWAFAFPVTAVSAADAQPGTGPWDTGRVTKQASITVSTFNVNGIRAAHRRGLLEWLAQDAPDVLLLQEVRAPEELTAKLLGSGWRVYEHASQLKGRAGVAVALNETFDWGEEPVVRKGLPPHGEETPADSGRWIEVEVVLDRPLTLVSTYLHSGQVGTEKQTAKMEHLPRVGARLEQLRRREEEHGEHALVAGDFNVVRSPLDVKNWKGNHNKTSGVLDEEIAFLNRWVEQGWSDIARQLAGETQGPYTWWSWRGKAFDNDAGWRIDYQYVTRALASRASGAWVVRAPSYDRRLSDHAPLSVSYRV